MLVLTESELRRLVPFSPAAVAAVEEGFRQLGGGGVATPPVLRLDFPEANGEIDVKAAHAYAWDSFAVKMSTGFFSNAQRGLPSANGLMVLFSAVTGEPLAVLLDGGYLTTVRTAAAGAVAAKWMAPAAIDTLGVVGTGLQAWFQVQAVLAVRPVQQVAVWGRDAGHAHALADRVAQQAGVPARVCAGLEELVATSGVVVTATPAKSPLVRGEWLRAGHHVTAVGTDAPDKQELDVAVWARADVAACDVRGQAVQMGDSHHAVAAGLLDPARLVELGDIVSGRQMGRPSPEAITVCDLTGTGIQDTAIARLACQAAREAGVGMDLRP